MDSHGKLEKEFFGERIAMMMAYYDVAMGCYPLYTSNSISLKEYCLSLGWDLAIYIHKYIKQPMDFQNYHALKDMTLRKMTKDDYLSYYIHFPWCDKHFELAGGLIPSPVLAEFAGDSVQILHGEGL